MKKKNLLRHIYSQVRSSINDSLYDYVNGSVYSFVNNFVIYAVDSYVYDLVVIAVCNNVGDNVHNFLLAKHE